jgi:hypothetical protein
VARRGAMRGIRPGVGRKSTARDCGLGDFAAGFL